MPKTKLSRPPIIADSKKRIWAPLMPYITISIGLLVFHNAWIAIIAYHLSMLVFLLISRRETSFGQLFGRHNSRILVVTFVFGASGGLLLYLLWPFLAVPADINQYLHNIGLTTGSWPYFIAYFILINPLIEECFWRGYLGGTSRNITLNDFLFSGYHLLVLTERINLTWLVAVFTILTLAAWFWRQSNTWNQGITASLVSHLAADTSVILTIYFMTVRS